MNSSLPTSDMRTRLALAAVASLALAAPLAAPLAAQPAVQPPGRPAPRARIQAVADSLVAAALGGTQASGMAIAVIRGADTIVMKGYGHADLENDVPATPRTVFRIGSLTKQFTAAAVMQLVDQGRVSLDDSIGKHLPGLPGIWSGVRVRQLLNHTSGIPGYTEAGPRWGTRSRLDLSHDSLLAIVRDLPLDFPTGARYRYSNTNYYLLGMLVERVSGTSYAEYVARHLAAPLGLESTLYCATNPVIQRRAQGYSPVRGQLLPALPISMNMPFAAGALCSSIRDLVVWQRGLMSGKVVSEASYRAMTTPEGAAADSVKYGYGLRADTLAGRRRIAHSGGINGFATSMLYLPAESLSVVVLVNTNGFPAAHLADNLARAAVGVPLVSRPGPPPPGVPAVVP